MGVHFIVTVTDGGWDTHVNNFRSLKDRLLPPSIVATLPSCKICTIAACSNTLSSGSATLAHAEGKSVRGRDHWSTAGVATMGGGGIKLGEVVGATNAQAEVVVDSPVRPQDIAATIYHALGIPLNTWYRSQDGRPIELVPTGRPVRQLI